MGVLHRRIELAWRAQAGGGEARAALEDDFHHFRVTVRHRLGAVTQTAYEAIRHPTALCPLAGEQLADIVGMELSKSSVAVMEKTDARHQCTHMIDLAGLAVAAAANETARRIYEASAPDRVNGRTTVRLRRDGTEILAWEMDQSKILGPAPYAGRDIGSGFTPWARATLAPDEAEAALVLRRAVFISGGRRVDLDDALQRSGPIGGCWSWQPERAARATRVIGSTLDFTDRASALTAADAAWIAFEE